MNSSALNFSILDISFSIAGTSGHLRELLLQNFAAYQSSPVKQPAFCTLHTLPDGQLTLESVRSGIIWQSSTRSIDSADNYFFLYALEKELTLELQRARHDLFFVHAAVLERAGRCILIAAESGTGKSTTAYALQSMGFRYMSDELAPIDIGSCSVFPYRHALCLKSVPPTPFANLPAHFVTERTIHIPESNLHSISTSDALPLGALIFLQRSGASQTPRLTGISPAEAATRLYANTLNALAHPNAGIDAAAVIVNHVPAWHLDAGGLAETCKLLATLSF